MQGNWCIYARLVNLHNIKPEKYKIGEFGIEFGIHNTLTDETKDVKVFINLPVKTPML